MGLQPHHAVEDLYTGILHAARPANVRSLVEARHQLHHQRGFLGGRGLSQRCEDGRVVAGAVEGLLHAHHRRVLRALLDEPDHRIVGVVGVVQQNIALAQLVEHIARLAAQVQRLGREWRKLQVRPLHIGIKEHEPRQVYGPLAAKDLILIELEVHPQPIHNFSVGSGLDFQPHRVALAPIVQLNPDRLQQRTRFLLFKVEVGIPGDPERRMSKHFVATVHAAKILRNQVLQQQIVEPIVRRGQTDEPRQCARHRHHPQHLRAGAAPFCPQQKRQAQSLVENTRKRMRRIDRDRRQQRIDLALKVVLRKSPGLFTQLLPLEQPDALLAQLGHKLVVPAAVLCGHKTVNLRGQHRQRLVRPQSVVARFAVAVLNAL